MSSSQTSHSPLQNLDRIMYESNNASLMLFWNFVIILESLSWSYRSAHIIMRTRKPRPCSSAHPIARAENPGRVTSVKIIPLNEWRCRDGMHHAKIVEKGNPLSNTYTTTIMRNPLPELCREGYA